MGGEWPVWCRMLLAGICLEGGATLLGAAAGTGVPAFLMTRAGGNWAARLVLAVILTISLYVLVVMSVNWRRVTSPRR